MLAGTSSFLMKMFPVSVTRSEGGRFSLMPKFNRRPHSFEFDLYQMEASGPWSRFVREALFPETG